MFEISVYFILKHISDEVYFTSQQPLKSVATAVDGAAQVAHRT